MKKTKEKGTMLVKIYPSTNKRLAIRIAMSDEKITRAELIDRMEVAYKQTG